LLQDILDEGLDELAVSAHAGALARVIVTVAAAVVFCLVLPWRNCAIWAAVTIMLEISAWFATRRQFLGHSARWPVRLWHVTSLAAGSIAWIVMGAMAWVSGTVEGAVCAIMMWLSVIFFAQSNAHQSRAGFVVGGAIPGALMLATVLFAPHAPGMRFPPVVATLLLCLIFAGEGVMRMVGARRRLDQAQVEIRSSEARYRLLTDNTTDIIIRYDLNGVIEFVSPSVRQLGYSPEQCVGRRMDDFGHPDDTAYNREGRETAARTDPTAIGERRQFRARKANGDYAWMESSPGPIRDENGVVIGVMTAYRDITVRRAMEEALRAKTIEAEAAALAKSDFLSNMSHEIRTPLTSIIGFSGLMDTIDNLPDEARTYARRIATAGQSLMSVVNDILDFSKIEAGHLELDPHPFDPAQMIAETLDLVQGQAQLKGLSLTVDLDEDLPAAVNADSARLRQVLLNLLNNALKFTARGGVTVSVRHAPEAGGMLRVEVADTGVGLSPEQAAKLFNRFTQADSSTSREHGGTGLGLAICRSLAELMGGEIGLHSEAGVGSTFWFTVAAPPAELEAGALDPDEAQAMAPARILVVDDVSVNRELVKALLSIFGHRITEACNGADAVKTALNMPFDLILMDLQMPGMDGIAATHAIRTTSVANARTPIVALSANVMANHIDACRQAGMDDHIGKPIDPGELLSKVAQWTAAADREAADPLTATG